MTTHGVPPSEPPSTPSPGPAEASTSADWTDQVTDLIVDSVDKVRARTTGPVLDVAHASVFGLVAAIVALPVLIAGLAGLVRLLDWIVPGGVWVVYLILAALMWGIGAILWARRERSDASQS